MSFGKNFLGASSQLYNLGNVGLGMARAKREFVHDMTDASPEKGLVEDFKQITTKKNNGKWGALFEGIASGLKYSVNKKESDARKEQLKSTQKTFEYFDQTIPEQMKDIAAYQKQQGLLMKVNPAAVQYGLFLGQNPNLEQANMGAESLINELKRQGVPMSGEFVGVDPKDKYRLMFQGQDGRLESVDARTYISADDVKTHPQLDPYQNALNMADIQHKQAQTDLVRANMGKIQQEMEYMPQRMDLDQQKLHISSRNADARLHNVVKKTVEEIDAVKDFQKTSPRLLEIAERNPKIFQSLQSVVWNKSEEPGYLENAIQDISKGLSQKDAQDVAVMVKGINKMKIDVARGFTRPNMFIERIGSRAVPNLNMPQGAFVKVMKEMLSDNAEKLKTLDDRLYAMDSTPDQMYYRGSFGGVQRDDGVPQVTPPPTSGNVDVQQGAQVGAQFVKMITPSGSIGNVPISKIQSAIEKGMKVAE